MLSCDRCLEFYSDGISFIQVLFLAGVYLAGASIASAFQVASIILYHSLSLEQMLK